MSFADELRDGTKTKEQLAAEKRQKEQQEFIRDVEHEVNKLKSYCKYAAEEGQRKLKKPWYWLDEYEGKLWPFHSAREAGRYAQAVKDRLLKEGLTDVKYTISGHGLFSNRRYNVEFVIRW